MDALVIVITVFQLLCGLAVILAVLFQSGKSAGLSGTIGGVADTFMAKGKAKSFDAKLARATRQGQELRRQAGPGHQVDRRRVHRPDPGAEHPALTASV